MRIEMLGDRLLQNNRPNRVSWSDQLVGASYLEGMRIATMIPGNRLDRTAEPTCSPTRYGGALRAQTWL